MGSQAKWRRLSDWKRSVRLVHLDDVDESILEAHDLVRPEERLRERGLLRLAKLLATTRLARVNDTLAAKLDDAGIVIYEVGYHRVSDGLFFAKGGRSREQRDVDMGALVAELTGDDTDDDAYDRMSADAVDAALRILSEGMVTEKAVIVAAAVPRLAAKGTGDEGDEPEAHDALEPAALPDVTEAFVDRVAEALAAGEDVLRVGVGPDLSPEARRSYQKRAAAVGALALAAAGVGLVWTPLVAVFASPVVVLCLVIIAIHEVALRQRRSR